MEHRSDSIIKIAEALSKAQGEMKPAEFDSVNTFFNKSRYASLASVVNAIRAPLAKYGLSVFQRVESEPDGQTIMVTVLMHSSGEWLSGSVPLILAKQDMQALGSAMTYARRYGLSSLLGVVSDSDDDGNAAVEKSAAEKPKADQPGKAPRQNPQPQTKPNPADDFFG